MRVHNEPLRVSIRPLGRKRKRTLNGGVQKALRPALFQDSGLEDEDPVALIPPPPVTMELEATPELEALAEAAPAATSQDVMHRVQESSPVIQVRLEGHLVTVIFSTLTLRQWGSMTSVDWGGGAADEEEAKGEDGEAGSATLVELCRVLVLVEKVDCGPNRAQNGVGCKGSARRGLVLHAGDVPIRLSPRGDVVGEKGRTWQLFQDLEPMDLEVAPVDYESPSAALHRFATETIGEDAQFRRSGDALVWSQDHRLVAVLPRGATRLFIGDHEVHHTCL